MSAINKRFIIRNKTDRRFRFQAGRLLIRFDPFQEIQVDISVQPAYKMLIEEIPNTHRGLFEVINLDQPKPPEEIKEQIKEEDK
jgi:hypothetical protein